jgi:hypothetical protein
MKRKDKVNCVVCKTQTWRGDKSHTNLEYDTANVKLRGPYAGTVFTVSACGTKLSGDQEDKLVSLRTLHVLRVNDSHCST